MGMVINGLGDVVALVQLTKEAVRTFDAAKHAPNEVSRLLEDADRYQSCIAAAANNIRRHGAVLKPHEDIKTSIIFFLKRCEETTKKLGKIATAYQEIVRKDGVATVDEECWKQWTKAFKTVYQQVKWTTKADIVNELRSELVRNIQILTYLNQQLLS